MTESSKMNDSHIAAVKEQRARGKKQFIIFSLVFLFFIMAAIVFQLVIITQRRLAMTGDGKDITSYKFDLSNLNVNKKLVVASGIAKDGQRVMTSPTVISYAKVKEINKASKMHPKRFVVSAEKVIGVTINGESRAYLIAHMRWHEIVNDVVGQVPIAVTYSPLTDSVVVFDRRVGGVGEKTVEFGYSGLLYNSNLLMYDRGVETGKQSLWSQLKFKPISGPAVDAGHALKVLPSYYISWGVWEKMYLEKVAQATENKQPVPKMDVMRGLDALRKKEYKTTTKYEKLLFPVSPLVKEVEGGMKLFDTVIAMDTPHGWEISPIAQSQTVPKFEQGQPILYARYFAWYAFNHKTDETQKSP